MVSGLLAQVAVISRMSLIGNPTHRKGNGARGSVREGTLPGAGVDGAGVGEGVGEGGGGVFLVLCQWSRFGRGGKWFLRRLGLSGLSWDKG